MTIVRPPKVSADHHKQLLPLFVLVAAIQAHDGLPKAIQGHENIKWLSGQDVSPPFKSLIDDLDSFCMGKLITKDGQHSDLFYDLREYGYLAETGESDSFGPLSAVISPPERNWRYCYG